MIKIGFCGRCQKAADPADLIVLKRSGRGYGTRHRDGCAFRVKKPSSHYAKPVAGQLRLKLHPSAVGKLEQWAKDANYD